MDSTAMTGAVALRDEAGTWYLLTPELLRDARASAAQQAALDAQAGGDTTGFGIIINELGNYSQVGHYQPLSMLGGLTLPAGASGPMAQTQSIVIEE